MALLRAAAAGGVRRALVYSGNIYRPGVTAVDEDAPIFPTARAPYYLISKACADFSADAFSREGTVDIAVLRPSAVYGPGLLRGVIWSFLNQLAAGKKLVIDDGGRYRADLVYVEDVAQGTVAALHSPARGVFNLGSGATLSSLEIARELARLLQAPSELLDVRPHVANQPPGFSPLDIRRAREAFGYAPREPIQGLADYVAWWRTT